MKIALIHGKMMVGALSGASVSICNLAAALKDFGEEVTIISSDNILPFNSINHEKVANTVYIGFSRLQSFNLMIILKSWYHIVRLVHYFFSINRSEIIKDYDIIDSQGPWTSRLNILTVRFCFIEYLLATRDGTIRQKLLDLLDMRMRILLWIERKMLFSSSLKAIITNCSKTKSALVEFYGIKENKITVIHNGFEYEKFSKCRRYRKNIRKRLDLNNKVVMLFVGYNPFRKNLKAFISYLRRYTQVHGIIVGVREEEIKNEIKGLKNFSLIGCSQEVEKYYGAADIFFFPTKYEAGAKVVFEAMASGCCVVTTLESGASDFIINGKNGFLFSSIEEGYEILDVLIMHPSWVRKIGKYAKTSVSSFTWEEAARKRIELYHSVIHNS